MEILTVDECGLVAGGFREPDAVIRPRRVAALKRSGAKRGMAHTDSGPPKKTKGPGSGSGSGSGGGGSGSGSGGGGSGGGSGGGGSGGGGSGGGGGGTGGGGGGSGGGAGGGGQQPIETLPTIEVHGEMPDAATPDAPSYLQVVYFFPDGESEALSGTHPNRDNNPLDMKDGFGRLGKDEGFSIFATPQQGFQDALDKMNAWNADGHTDSAYPQYSFTAGHETLNDIIGTWSPPSENNTAQMQQTIPSWADLSGSDSWGSLTEAQQVSFLNAYAKYEGYKGPPATL